MQFWFFYDSSIFLWIILQNVRTLHIHSLIQCLCSRVVVTVFEVRSKGIYLLLGGWIVLELVVFPVLFPTCPLLSIWRWYNRLSSQHSHFNIFFWDVKNLIQQIIFSSLVFSTWSTFVYFIWDDKFRKFIFILPKLCYLFIDFLYMFFSSLLHATDNLVFEWYPAFVFEWSFFCWKSSSFLVWFLKSYEILRTDFLLSFSGRNTFL